MAEKTQVLKPQSRAPVQRAALPAAPRQRPEVAPGARGSLLARRAAMMGTASAADGRMLQRSVGNRQVGMIARRQVMRKCAGGESCGCASCQGHEEIRRKANGASPSTLPASVAGMLGRGGGQPLPAATREHMEAALDADLGGVRLHTGAAAAQASSDINAEAFTHGQDVFFGADKYQPETNAGRELLAHELVHTVQQRGAGPAVQGAPAISQPGDELEREAETIARQVAAGEPADRISTGANISTLQRQDDDEGVLGWLANTAGEVAETAGDIGGGIAETASEVAGAVGDAASDVVGWLATEAGQLATALARATGGVISISPAGLEIRIARHCLDVNTFSFDPGSIDQEFTVPIAAVPVGSMAIAGSASVAAHMQPLASIEIGPFCQNEVRILVNPFTGDYSINGSVSLSAAALVQAEINGLLRGDLSVTGVIPVGGMPIPIQIPVAGLEGGLDGTFQARGASTLTVGSGLAISGGIISSSQSRQLDLGLSGDLSLGAYGLVDVGGQNICQLAWQRLDWHGAIGGSLGLAWDSSIVPGGLPPISISSEMLKLAAFGQMSVVLSRGGFSDNCLVMKQLCDVLRALNLLPSQNGGEWNWSGPYGPGTRLQPLDGPFKVYESNPAIASESACRGACGPDCLTCKTIPAYQYTDPITGDVWEYKNFQDCDSHKGCRKHDAAYDWAAAVHGEVGFGSVIMPWHMAANIECACNFPVGDCVGWIAGRPPYDSKIYFADSVTQVPLGTGGPGPAGAPCAVPVNFRQTAAADVGGGTLQFKYAWESSTGVLADLAACEVGEKVDYPGAADPFIWPSPPWDGGGTQNPTIIWLPARRGRAEDNHSTRKFLKPYRRASFTANQLYRYHCPCKNGDDPVALSRNISIVRAVTKNADGTFKYRITKTGAAAEIDPLP